MTAQKVRTHPARPSEQVGLQLRRIDEKARKLKRMYGDAEAFAFGQPGTAGERTSGGERPDPTQGAAIDEGRRDLRTSLGEVSSFIDVAERALNRAIEKIGKGDLRRNESVGTTGQWTETKLRREDDRASTRKANRRGRRRH